MLQTKGIVTLRSSNKYNHCIWRWDEQTLEGAFLSKDMWEAIPPNRLMLAARDGLRYTLVHGSIMSGQIGRLADDEIEDFCIALQDDGVYVDFTVQGKAKQRLDNPLDDGSRYYYGIYMDRAWIGVLFSPELSELKETLLNGLVSETELAKYGFRKVLWDASSATYSSGEYIVKLNGHRTIDLNF